MMKIVYEYLKNKYGHEYGFFSYHQWIMLQYPYIVDEYVKFVPTTIFDVVQLSSILYKEISHLPSGHIQITDVIIIAHIVK